MYTANFDYLDRCDVWKPRESMADLVLRCAARADLPGIVAPPAALQSCADRIAAAPCGRWPEDCRWYGQLPFPVAPGTRAVGESCDVDAQCVSGLCGTGIGPCAVCATRSHVGEACSPTALCVDRQLRCVDGTCVDTGDPLGAPCIAPKGDSRCQRTLYCPGDRSVCTPRVKLGDPCSGPGYNPMCPAGTVCFAGVCAAVGTATHGGACSEVALCPAGEHCRDGSCYLPKVNVAEGGSCVWDYCAAGLHCLEYVCTRPRTDVPEGGACGSWVSCEEGLYCGLTTCQPRRTAGAGCVGDSQCAAGLKCRYVGPGNDGVCAVAPAPAAEGQPCGYVGCAAGLLCVSLDGGASYSCQHRGLAGERCTSDLPCRAPLECSYPTRDGYYPSGTCRAPNACSAP